MYNDQPRDWVHATTVEAIISDFTKTDGVVMPESPYNFYGVKGIIDIARFRPAFASGCRADFLEVETRMWDVNAIIRKVRERGLVYPEYLHASRQIKLGQVTSWLVIPATEENAEVLLQYVNTFATLFGMGTRVPQSDGIRYGLAVVDPLAFSGVKALPLSPLIEAGTLESTLADLCRYADKPDLERALLRHRRGERELEQPVVRAV